MQGSRFLLYVRAGAELGEGGPGVRVSVPVTPHPLRTIPLTLQLRRAPTEPPHHNDVMVFIIIMSCDYHVIGVGRVEDCAFKVTSIIVTVHVYSHEVTYHVTVM